MPMLRIFMGTDFLLAITPMGSRRSPEDGLTYATYAFEISYVDGGKLPTWTVLGSGYND